MIGRIFRFLFVFNFLIFVGCSEVKSSTDFYNFNVFAKNMFLRIYINDAEIMKTADFNQISFTEGLRKYLINGENNIVIDVAPFDTSNSSYEFHDDVKLEITIDGYTSENGIRSKEREIHLAAFTFDENGHVIEEDKGEFTGKKVLYKSGNIQRIGFEDVGEISIPYRSDSSTTNSKRFEIKFDVADGDIINPPWINALEIKEYSDIEEKVLDKYKDIWTSISKGDYEKYIDILGTVLDRTAYTTGYSNRYEVASKIFPNNNLVPDGATLMDLNDWEKKYKKSYVTLSPNRKLVRINPNPIRFYDRDGKDRIGMSYYLCMTKTGIIDVCYQKDTGM